MADFDECAAGSDGCSQTCTNVDGGFNCGCEFGFSLGDDRKSCQKGTLPLLLIFLLNMFECVNVFSNSFLKDFEWN